MTSLNLRGANTSEHPVPELPWRYRDDAYYGKGNFAVEFRVEPANPDDPPDETALHRALQQLLLTLRDETKLKVSAFVDVWDPETGEAVGEPERDRDAAADEPKDQWAAEFVIYNKLGPTSLSKLRRFMENHLKGDVTPRIILIDPQTGDRFKATHFTIRYLFNEFVAHHQPDDWERLRELVAQEDRGYRELTKTAAAREFTYRGHRYRSIG